MSANYTMYFDPTAGDGKWVIEENGRPVFQHSDHDKAKARYDRFLVPLSAQPARPATAAGPPPAAIYHRPMPLGAASYWFTSAGWFFRVGESNVARGPYPHFAQAMLARWAS